MQTVNAVLLSVVFFVVGVLAMKTCHVVQKVFGPCMCQPAVGCCEGNCGKNCRVVGCGCGCDVCKPGKCKCGKDTKCSNKCVCDTTCKGCRCGCEKTGTCDCGETCQCQCGCGLTGECFCGKNQVKACPCKWIDDEIKWVKLTNGEICLVNKEFILWILKEKKVRDCDCDKCGK